MNRVFSMLLCAVLFALVMTQASTADETRGKQPQILSQSQGEMNREAEDAYKRADSELNRVYKSFISKLSEKQKDALIDAELAWIKFRDANCACWALPNKGGSIYPLVYFGCMEEMTKQRTTQLLKMHEEILSNE